MVKGRTGQRVRLYIRGTILGFKRWAAPFLAMLSPDLAIHFMVRLRGALMAMWGLICRSKSDQYESMSLAEVEGVNTKEDVAWSGVSATEEASSALLCSPVRTPPNPFLLPWPSGRGSNRIPSRASSPGRPALPPLSASRPASRLTAGALLARARGTLASWSCPACLVVIDDDRFSTYQLCYFCIVCLRLLLCSVWFYSSMCVAFCPAPWEWLGFML